MGKYRITAARPKDDTTDLKSEFKLYEYQQQPDKSWKWHCIEWKTIHDVSTLLKDGHEVRTGKVELVGGKRKMSDGAAVELELRIATNDTKYKISEMPDS